jgi:hypothetical protein
MSNTPASFCVSKWRMSKVVDMMHPFLLNHYLSCDKTLSTVPQAGLPCIEYPTQQLASLWFFQLSGFWTVPFKENSGEIELPPIRILLFSYFYKMEKKRHMGGCCFWFKVTIVLVYLCLLGDFLSSCETLLKWCLCDWLPVGLWLLS